MNEEQQSKQDTYTNELHRSRSNEEGAFYSDPT